LLDEPTNGLDVMATRHLRDWLRELRGQGRCVLLSSHVMQEVEALVDELVIIAAGRVTLTGSPAELAQRFPGRSLRRSSSKPCAAPRGAPHERRPHSLPQGNSRDAARAADVGVAAARPFVRPILFTVLMNVMISRNLSSIDEVLEVPILGAEHAPNLIAHLRARSIEPLEQHDVKDVDRAAELVATGEYDVVLVIDDKFEKDFGTERAGRVALVFDRSKSRAASRVSRLRGAIDGYGQTIGTLRLVANSVDPSLLRPLVVDELDVRRRRAARR
jgi:hypothetical protein